jgi:hypothetical protein
MIVIADLRSSKLSFAISFPSIIIYPLKDSKILSKDIIIVDFPLPVLPTTPIFSPAVNTTFNPLKTGSRFGLYLTQKSMKLISPLSGQTFVNLLLPSLALSALLIFKTSLFLRY